MSLQTNGTTLFLIWKGPGAQLEPLAYWCNRLGSLIRIKLAWDYERALIGGKGRRKATTGGPRRCCNTGQTAKGYFTRFSQTAKNVRVSGRVRSAPACSDFAKVPIAAFQKSIGAAITYWCPVSSRPARQIPPIALYTTLQPRNVLLCIGQWAAYMQKSVEAAAFGGSKVRIIPGQLGHSSYEGLAFAALYDGYVPAYR